MTARDFLTLAGRLAAGTEEAEWRTAVSRAYYATFHIARAFFHDLGFRVPREERAHKYLSFRLMNAGNPDAAFAGTQLDRLRGDRNAADYDLTRPIHAAQAVRLVQLAEEIVDRCDALRHDPVRKEITDAMKEYERTVLGEVTWQPSP